ncbi:MAG: secretin N-terminal domain-containing protein [Gammaproteobacteria bacterium]
MKKLLYLLFCWSLYQPAAAEEMIMEVIPLQNRIAEEVQPLIEPLLQHEDRVIANGTSLIIRTTPSRLAEIRRFLQQLDTPVENLIITVVQDRDITADEMNASADIRLNVPLNHPSNVSGNIRGRYYQIQDRDSRYNTQTIRTMEGTPAHIRVGKVHPVTTTTIHPYYGYPAVSSSTEFVEATTGFAVTPRLAGDRQVVIDVAPWSDRMNRYGAIETQGAQTSIRANLGEWVEIGGADEDGAFDRSGFLVRERSTRKDTLHILIKVDKAR